MADEHASEAVDVELDASAARRPTSRGARRRAGRRSSRERPNRVLRRITSRSALPRTTRAPSSDEDVEDLAGHGPVIVSPTTTTASTPSRSTSASTASSAGRLPWMSLIAATRTARGYRATASRGPAQTRSSAGQSEQANSLGVGRKSPARMRAIAAESSASSSATSSRVNDVDTTSSGRSRNWYAISTSLEPAAQADERIDEPLQPVLGLDDLGRLAPVERVRLVVDDERALAVLPEHVEPAADEDAVVLERERPLRPGAAKVREPRGERRRAVRVDERGDPLELVLR